MQIALWFLMIYIVLFNEIMLILYRFILIYVDFTLICNDL